MWSSSYDENLENNPFLQEITTNHSDIIAQVSQNAWIICIPKTGTLKLEEITPDGILDHILIPGEPPTYTTLNHKQVSIKHQEIIEEQTTKILFEETFYVKNEKFTVLCLEKPLFTNIKTCDNHDLIILQTLDDCIEFLWKENLEHLLVKIQKLCDDFITTNRRFQLENLQNQREIIGSLYSHCLQLVLKDEKLNCCDNLKLAVETYMQSCLDKVLIRAINTITCFSDANLNKLIRKLHSTLLLQEDDLKTKTCNILPNIEWQLNNINNYNTTLDKINCLQLTFNNLYKGGCLSTDDVLQNFILLILKSNVSNWYSNLVYLSQFSFSLEISNETNFLVTSLEAALEYLKSGHCRLGETKSSGAIFDTIAQGDLIQLQTLLEYNKTTSRKLCHPLCDCENCRVKTGPLLATTNQKGQNLLTFAAIMGRSDMVEFLLSRQIDIVKDHFGRLPIHYACQHGYQDILLILVNCGDDINNKDFEGNTPLHLACLHGHDSCVKALFYAAKNLHFNNQNKHNETPLSIAIKNNFIEIMRVLLENGAMACLDNKKNGLLDMAQNYYSVRLLRQYHNYTSPPRGVKLRCEVQNKKVDLLLKAIENNDLPLAYFYLGFPPKEPNGGYDFKSKCHPLCNCQKCEQGEGETSFYVSKEKWRVNICNVDGFTPLHFAAKFGRGELLRLLLDAQASPNVKTFKTLQTPLHLACNHGRVGVVKELIKCGDCDLDAIDYKGNTALYYAWRRGEQRIVEILLANGARGRKMDKSTLAPQIF